MKKISMAALTAVTALSLAACNEAADDTATTDDTVVVEDGTDTIVVDETMPADEDGVTIGVDGDGVDVEGSVDINDDVSVDVDTDGN